MAFRVCQCMKQHVHPDAMLDSMTLRQYQEWVAFYDADPWGEERADQRAAANTMYTLAPYTKGPTDLPDLTYPYFDNETEDDLLTRARKISDAAKALSDGSDNDQPTSDCPGA